MNSISLISPIVYDFGLLPINTDILKHYLLFSENNFRVEYPSNFYSNITTKLFMNINQFLHHIKADEYTINYSNVYNKSAITSGIFSNSITCNYMMNSEQIKCFDLNSIYVNPNMDSILISFIENTFYCKEIDLLIELFIEHKITYKSKYLLKHLIHTPVDNLSAKINSDLLIQFFYFLINCLKHDIEYRHKLLNELQYLQTNNYYEKYTSSNLINVVDKYSGRLNDTFSFYKYAKSQSLYDILKIRILNINFMEVIDRIEVTE